MALKHVYWTLMCAQSAGTVCPLQAGLGREGSVGKTGTAIPIKDINTSLYVTSKLYILLYCNEHNYLNFIGLSINLY